MSPRAQPGTSASTQLTMTRPATFEELMSGTAMEVTDTVTTNDQELKDLVERVTQAQTDLQRLAHATNKGMDIQAARTTFLKHSYEEMTKGVKAIFDDLKKEKAERKEVTDSQYLEIARASNSFSTEVWNSIEAVQKTAKAQNEARELARARTEENLRVIDAALRRSIEKQEAWNASVQAWAGRKEEGESSTAKAIMELAEETKRHRDEMKAMKEDAKKTAKLILEKAKRYAQEGRELDEAAVLSTLGASSRSPSKGTKEDKKKWEDYRGRSQRESSPTVSVLSSEPVEESEDEMDVDEEFLEAQRQRLAKLKGKGPASSVGGSDNGGKPPGKPPKANEDPADSSSSDSSSSDSEDESAIGKEIRRLRRKAEKRKNRLSTRDALTKLVKKLVKEKPSKSRYIEEKPRIKEPTMFDGND